MHWGISPCVFNFLWKLEEQKFPQNGMPNFENSVQNYVLLTEKF